MALFQLFDYDQDGVVNKKEGQGMLRCLGFNTEDARMAELVRRDTCSLVLQKRSIRRFVITER